MDISQGAAPMTIQHSAAFKRRRFFNWFPMGLTYAFLYMGRYNLTVAKNALGDMMTKEDFGLIFGAGTMVYAVAFLINGPLTDKLGGKKAILAAALGSCIMNVLMGTFVHSVLTGKALAALDLTVTMAVLYAANMYFQSAAAVAIVKVNAHWFHVRERGGFSGIFGTMISSGIFFAFTVNGWVLAMTQGEGGGHATWWVFFLPASLLFTMFVIELFLLRDRPGQAGFADFDTGDASSGDEGEVRIFEVIRRVLTHPVILTVAIIEFCTGVIRNGVMHWFPIYVKEVWALPSNHALRDGSWGAWWVVVALFAAAVGLFWGATRAKGRMKAYMIITGGLLALAPFMQAGWGGWLFVAGVIGGNVAGWVSDLFFQSRRAPAAGGLYLMLSVCALVMVFALGGTTTVVGWAAEGRTPLRPGDKVISVAGRSDLSDWVDVTKAIACIPSSCVGEGVHWDAERCMCSSKAKPPAEPPAPSTGVIEIVVEREGARLTLNMKDPLVTARAGDSRSIPAGPRLTLTPFILGILMFLVSLGVIGTHGLLSGTATMDFGGRKGAATAVGIIDGFVYLGTAVQSVSLGFLTSKDWTFWPIFLFPFTVLGFVLLRRIWYAVPKGKKHGPGAK